ncbi:MAG: hypothetical protein B6D68_00580 [spirochete symbiont of Stewartia floridana]|nr:MAG: hypothetical protein B6D68_00580 [spirochete symbiont of Stewartia floridana]
MSIIQAVLLGMLQGLTEFLPVSSSGHLVLARAMMGIDEIPVLFDVVLHIATLIVVVWTFRVRIGTLSAAVWRFLRRRSKSQDKEELIFTIRLLEATVVTAVIGFAVSMAEWRRNPFLVAMMLIVTALILLSTLFSKVRGKGMGKRHSLIIGGAQGFGVIPGISRSGITISTGLLMGMDRKTAGTFSLLLSIPAIMGAALISLKSAGDMLEAVPIASLAAGFIAALFIGYGCLRFLLWLIADGKLWIFALYLIPIGTWAMVRFMPN